MWYGLLIALQNAIVQQIRNFSKKVIGTACNSQIITVSPRRNCGSTSLDFRYLLIAKGNEINAVPIIRRKEISLEHIARIQSVR